MKKLECPSCCQPSFTVWQKILLGPARKIRCDLCGASVSIPWVKGMLIIFLASFFPPIGAVVASFLLPHQMDLMTFVVVLVVGGVAGLALLGWLYWRWVPLVVKHDKQPQTNEV